jgi:hypothetical protein
LARAGKRLLPTRHILRRGEGNGPPPRQGKITTVIEFNETVAAEAATRGLEYREKANGLQVEGEALDDDTFLDAPVVGGSVAYKSSEGWFEAVYVDGEIVFHW